ncbi:MAG: high-potential iron-sulfur protein [Rhodanobacter sp.]|jgi:hypothetical protein|nr:high-potential iron-sulfur protein [Rhodanobacter sp.]
MSTPADRQSRRRFLKIAAISAAAAPIAAALLPRTSFAEDLPHLDGSVPAAQALKYTEDASSASGNPKHQEGASCSSCNFFQGKAGDAYGPCQLFPGHSVHAKGWCESYAKKA